jgi:hypothetical protein
MISPAPLNAIWTSIRKTGHFTTWPREGSHLWPSMMETFSFVMTTGLLMINQDKENKRKSK